MFRSTYSVSIALSLLCLGGCAPMSPYTWYNAPPNYQEQQIQRFDPYPDNDIGPVMEGVRPPDFQYQVAEPARGRWIGGGASFPRRALGY